MVIVCDFSPRAGIITVLWWQRRGLDRIFSIRSSGRWVGRYIELLSMGLKERNQNSREWQGPVALGICRVGTMVPSLLWDWLCMVLTLIRMGQVSKVVCPGNRLGGGDLHA